MKPIKVVQVDWMGNYTDGKIVRADIGGTMVDVPLVAVIELTEEPVYNQDGIPQFHTNGEPLHRWVSEGKVRP